ncbi:MAG: hypothetical protein QW625_00415 [Candidatus Nanoarchaeia archaeon]
MKFKKTIYLTIAALFSVTCLFASTFAVIGYYPPTAVGLEMKYDKFLVNWGNGQGVLCLNITLTNPSDYNIYMFFSAYDNRQGHEGPRSVRLYYGLGCNTSYTQGEQVFIGMPPHYQDTISVGIPNVWLPLDWYGDDYEWHFIAFQKEVGLYKKAKLHWRDPESGILRFFINKRYEITGNSRY